MIHRDSLVESLIIDINETPNDDILSALEDFKVLVTGGSSVEEAIDEVLKDYNVKENVLRIRIEKAYGPLNKISDKFKSINKSEKDNIKRNSPEEIKKRNDDKSVDAKRVSDALKIIDKNHGKVDRDIMNKIFKILSK
jgi:hypothetical protein